MFDRPGEMPPRVRPLVRPPPADIVANRLIYNDCGAVCCGLNEVAPEVIIEVAAFYSPPKV